MGDKLETAEQRGEADLKRRLRETEASLDALLSGPIDAVVASAVMARTLLSKAEGALRESDARYLRIVETANEGIFTLDNRGRFTFVNRRLVEMVGYDAKRILGKSLIEFLPTESKARAVARIEGAQNGYSETNEEWVTRENSSRMWALIKTSPIKDADGNYMGLLAMMTDKTRSRDAEDALRKSE
jgi:PAS domain S-box-containing protein